MPTPESMVKFVNQRMQDIEKFFGVQSYEYNRAKNIIYQNFGQHLDILLKQNKKTGAVQLSRSKRALSAFSNIVGKDLNVLDTNTNIFINVSDVLKSVASEFKAIGTVRQMAIEYVDNKKITKKELESIKEDIRKMSYERLRSSYVDDDLYDELNNLIDEEIDKRLTNPDEYDETFLNALEKVHDVITERGRNRNYAYALGERMLNDAKIEHEKFLRYLTLSGSSPEFPLGTNE